MLKLFKHLKPYSKQLTFILVLLFIQTMAQLYLPTLLSEIVDTGIINGDVNYILKIGGLMILVAFIGSIATIFASFVSSKVAMGFGRDVRRKIFTKAESFSLGEFDTVGTASLITRTTNDVNQVQQVLIMILRMMVTAPLTCIGGIIMAISVDKDLSLILLVSMPLVLIAIGLIGKKGMPRFKAMQVKLDKINKILRENLTGIRVIRAFNKQKFEVKRFEEANTDFTENAIKVNKIIALLMPILMLILNVTSVAILWFGAKRIDVNAMEVGNLMAFLQYVMQIMFSLIMVSMLFIMIPRASASADRINEVLAIDPKIVDKEPTNDKTIKKGYVKFDNVSFFYPGAESPAVSNISFETKPGETTAIIGGTGSGKSTILNLLERFYDASEGKILVDDIDIKDMSQQSLREKIGFVPQKAVLFSGTIAENLRYGKEDATAEDLVHASKIAQAYDFISEKENNFDSIVEQGGKNFSGGQKQRLAIARALIRKPEIYVFDDSFSALDFKTDSKLRAALKNETKESAVIIVAQRVSTIMDADRILVLDDGNVVGMGTHKELLNNCAIYKEIASSQLSEEELSNEHGK
ncbi:MAG: ABC transporter ATP-binding protein [Clostridium baratii]|uniref:ABC transporter family protein n=1 Tax=Clostridium baratii str. Sullivan TaxID=1415775 RepID=A0A0A7FSI1_9CLOT|nr:ABC transporter ATP-binding protein [Clostridium baratii]AIY82604.1 ABC transporter family protein [Clostridium baratii str. Sullivan]MBS6007434.1 ABC transporter ATP-binding protein [Clostridium baratii]MDU1054789.1 ABC transporter ATP-binding protein [Clostridium baratii]MDU4911920.1 ABC transporter ATP-binding protein [Clostridium baratii]